MQEFKFREDSSITLKIEGETFRVFAEVLAECLANVSQIMEEDENDISAEKAKERCEKIALEFDRAFNSDRAIERIFESAGREMNLVDMHDIVNYVSEQSNEFVKKLNARQSG